MSDAVHPLTALREQLNLSAEALAERTGLSPRTIRRAERRAPLNPTTRQLLCERLGQSADQLGLVPRRPASQQARHSQLLANGEGDDVRRRELLSVLNAAGAVITLPTTLDLDRGDVSTDLAAMRVFRTADPQLGGARMYAAVVRYLEARVAPRLFGNVPTERGSGVFCVAAALTDMAGWMAHDAGQDALAERHFARALDLAKVGSDRELEAHVFASRSHLAHRFEQPALAIAFARAGQTTLRRGRRNPGLQARLHAMEARSHAARRDAGECLRSLLRAEKALSTLPSDTPSEWTSHFDEASLASEAAQCLRTIGRLTDARRQAERVIALRAADRARSRAFGQLALAGAMAEQRRLEEACAVGREVLGATKALGSLRVVQQLQDLCQLLQQHRSAKEVGEFLDSAAEELRGRVARYHGLGHDGCTLSVE